MGAFIDAGERGVDGGRRAGPALERESRRLPEDDAEAEEVRPDAVGEVGGEVAVLGVAGHFQLDLGGRSRGQRAGGETVPERIGKTLPLIGVDITVLSVFGGALGVGLGLGLQKIASNYVSGFIILLDRSLRLGDVVTVDNRTGKVIDLTNRYVVLHGLDGVESIVPNDTFITSTVVKQTHTDNRVRLALTIQISYGSALEAAMRLMQEAARKQPRVLAEPEPMVFLKEFSDNGINLELGFWISDPEEGQIGLRSAINMEIWREFQNNGIEIPFPQREVRLLDKAT